jgi:hypothetical protein
MRVKIIILDNSKEAQELVKLAKEKQEKLLSHTDE